MALINTIAEIRAQIPGISKLTDTAQMPNMSLPEWEHILPVIGQGLYDRIDLKYNAEPPTLTDAEKILLAYIQLPLSAFALADHLAGRQAVIVDGGVRVAETEKLRPAHRWEFEKLHASLLNMAAKGLERLISHLFQTKADWPESTVSVQYKEASSLFITTADDFARQYPLQYPFRTWWMLRPLILDVEENYFVPTFGRKLLRWIRENEMMITEDSQEVDIKRMLKRSMAHLVIYHACAQLRVGFTHEGFTILQGDSENPETAGKKTPASSDIYDKAQAAQREGQNYLARAVGYITKIGDGDLSADFNDDFFTGFADSPLNVPDDEKITDRGNGRRKMFRL